jgi:hypothetical protein
MIGRSFRMFTFGQRLDVGRDRAALRRSFNRPGKHVETLVAIEGLCADVELRRT